MGIDLLYQAELSARYFSKMRLALSPDCVDLSKHSGYAIEWSRRHKKFLPSESELQKLGLSMKSHFPSVDYYKCTHDKYEELKDDRNKLDYLRFKILRNYFSIKRLENIPQEYIAVLSLKLGTRETILSEGGFNTNNSRLIDNLRLVEDIEWFFNIETSTFYLEMRMPSFYGPLIFNERGLFPNEEFQIVSRTSFGSQRNKDDKAISHLLIISSHDKENYEKIADFSYNSLLQLVDDKELFQRCNDIQKEFENVKVGM